MSRPGPGRTPARGQSAGAGGRSALLVRLDGRFFLRYRSRGPPRIGYVDCIKCTMRCVNIEDDSSCVAAVRRGLVAMELVEIPTGASPLTGLVYEPEEGAARASALLMH